MKQLDFFEETLDKKITRLEKWLARLQKEMVFLKEVQKLSYTRVKPAKEEKVQQFDMFAG